MAEVRLVSVDELVFSFARERMSVPVVNAVPASRPAEFLHVYRAGGGASSRVLDEAVVVGQGWAASRARAEEIASEWRDLLLNEAAGMRLVRRVTVQAGPYSDPDPESRSPRFTVTARLVVRASRR